MSFIVTGAAGFIGANIVKGLNNSCLLYTSDLPTT